MRNRELHGALREFALEAAAQLTADLEGGAELPYDVVEEPGTGSVLYRYLPLTSDFIRERWDVLRTMTPKMDQISANMHQQNYKALLQQHAQKALGSTPLYELLDEKGPDHSKCFKIGAQVGRRTYSGAWGRNKKEAEQKAAMNALAEISGEPAPHAAD